MDNNTIDSHVPFVESEKHDEDEVEDEEEELMVDGVDIIRNCYCMACGGGNGVTRMMIHKIPYFRELVIASYKCPDCYETNNEVSFGGEIQPQGQKLTLLVTAASDLDRQIIKSDSATLRIEELDFEIPAMTQKGAISTIEGFLSTAAKDLSLMQSERMISSPEIGSKIAAIIYKLTMMTSGDLSMFPFHIIVDDIAGNSYIQNPYAPDKDPHMTMIHYMRSIEHDTSLGLSSSSSSYQHENDTNYPELLSKPFGSSSSSSTTTTTTSLSLPPPPIHHDEAISIPSPCPNCQQEGVALTAVTTIPHFKEVLIMAFTCEYCGFRNNEVKGGGAVPDRGTEVRLIISSPDDLKRDILKSDSSMVCIPELELELQHGTLGGVYTTVEGLLYKIHTALTNDNPFMIGDSTTLHHSASSEINDTKMKFQSFLDNLLSYAQGKSFPFTLILRDPLGNSFISAPLGSFLPPEMDHNLSIDDFIRSYDENEEFGLNDINTIDYESGVDKEVYYKDILSDRLTHVTIKGEDHPTFYAKATNDDNTPGGKYLSCDHPSSSSSPHVSSSHVSSSLAVDDIIISHDYHHRKFNEERDHQLSFLPYEEFSGRKAGYVYRLGARGLGYYQDVLPVIIPSDEPVSSSSPPPPS